jgi:hypothetical protein
MAHFAEIDENNTVLRIIVIDDEDTADDDGSEVESIGQQFCADLLGGTWVQTSYNHNQKAKYAAIGDTYDAGLDAFYGPQPFPSWTLDASIPNWVAPVAHPVPASEDDDGETYKWDEDTTSWIEAEAS